MKTFTLFRNGAREWRTVLPPLPADATPDTWYRAEVEVDDYPRLHEVEGQGLVLTWGGTRAATLDRLTVEEAIQAGRARERETRIAR